jgi:uncharacterized YigZ family protein
MNSTDSYFTISRPAEGFYKEKGSKFLATAFAVKSEEEVQFHLEESRKKYHDARHHCYAYIFGIGQAFFRASDDGEPGHSAGDPILGQIRSRELTNVLIIVVRYFGGTKLGVPGLINAYKSAASDALDLAGRKQVEITQNVLIKFTYDITSDVMPLVKDHIVLNQEFTDNCSLEIEVRSQQLEALASRLKVLQDMGKSLEFEIKK